MHNQNIENDKEFIQILGSNTSLTASSMFDTILIGEENGY